jgi:outer membrane protein assembly factor BamD
MRAQTTLKTVAAACAAALIATGCGGLPEKTDETAGWTPNKLYSEAQDSLASGDFSKCAKYFEMLEGRDPFGRFAQQAQLNVAYCSWKDNDATAANEAVDRFIRLHPDNPSIDYAYYLKGLINFNDDLGLFGRFSGQDMSERDPKALRDSYDAFRVVVDKYPTSKFAPDAAQRMRYIVNALAAHEVHAADYYYRRGAYLAAVNRAQQTIQQYQNTPAVEDALHIMVLSYQALGQTQLASDTTRVLNSTFPQSAYLASNGERVKRQKHWWQIW